MNELSMWLLYTNAMQKATRKSSCRAAALFADWLVALKAGHRGPFAGQDVYPAEDCAAYGLMEDLDYDAWLLERKAEQEKEKDKEVERQMKMNSFLWPENGRSTEKEEDTETV